MEGALDGHGQFLSVGLFTAVEGGDGEVNMIWLRVVAHGVTVWDQRPKTHHAVCVSGNLQVNIKFIGIKCNRRCHLRR